MQDTDLRDIFSNTQNDSKRIAATAYRSPESKERDTATENKRASISASETPQQALARIRAGNAPHNEAQVIFHFAQQGILEENIVPRENCLTYKAWKALGRQVQKGQHGCKLTTFTKQRDDTTGKNVSRMFRTTVFHISQTKKA